MNVKIIIEIMEAEAITYFLGKEAILYDFKYEHRVTDYELKSNDGVP